MVSQHQAPHHSTRHHTMHHPMQWPMHGPACPWSQTPIWHLLTEGHSDYVILLLCHNSAQLPCYHMYNTIFHSEYNYSKELFLEWIWIWMMQDILTFDSNILINFDNNKQRNSKGLTEWSIENFSWTRQKFFINLVYFVRYKYSGDLKSEHPNTGIWI